MIVREWSLDCYGCEGNLDDAAAIEAALREGARRIGAVVMGQCTTRYQPIGTTVFLPLAESHAMVTTWPEHRYAIVSVLLCNASMDPRLVVDSVLAVLRAASTRLHEIEHTARAAVVQPVPAEAGK